MNRGQTVVRSAPAFGLFQIVDVHVAAFLRVRTKALVPFGRLRHRRAGEIGGDHAAVDDRPNAGENEHDLDDFFKHPNHSYQKALLDNRFISKNIALFRDSL